MFLTTKKPLDESILLVDSSGSGSRPPSLHWTTTRGFIESAAAAAVRAGIYVPPLAENATSWSRSTLRVLGHEIKLFDSIYAACNLIDFNRFAAIGADESEAIMFYVGQAVDAARHNFFEGNDWPVGLFENADFHIASTIFSMRYSERIIDVMIRMGAGEHLDFDRAYNTLSRLNGWSPAQFVNAAVEQLGLVDTRDASVFTTAERAMISGVGDEYRALIDLALRDCEKKGTLVISEFERSVLKLNFAIGEDVPLIGNRNEYA
jgi:hypothetical protein